MNTDLVKALRARRYVGWYAYFRRDSRMPWRRLDNRAGLGVLYATREAALERAAEACRSDGRAA